MALSRLGNTEKRLLEQSSVGDDYKQIIASFVEKGYIRKVNESKGQLHDVWYLPIFRSAVLKD